MQDATFNAQIKSAALTARDEDDKTIRRVRFALASTFTLELAEWLGPVAMNQRDLLVNGDLKSFKDCLGFDYTKIPPESEWAAIDAEDAKRVEEYGGKP